MGHLLREHHSFIIIQLQVDYVIVFSLLPLQSTVKSARTDHQDTTRAAHAKELADEYQLIIQRLKSAGLSATGRIGSKGSNELLILVTAHNETRIKQEIQAERYVHLSITHFIHHENIHACFHKLHGVM
jgi:hypothetical protein